MSSLPFPFNLLCHPSSRTMAPPHTTHSTHSQNQPLVRLGADGEAFDPDLETRWSRIKTGLSTVHYNMQNHLKTPPAEWADIYSHAAYLYNQNDAVRKRRMYSYVRQFIRELVRTQLHHLRPLDGVTLLSEYIRRWQSTMAFVMFMKRVLGSMQKFWIAQAANTLKTDPIRPLDKLLMFYWREDLLSGLSSIVGIALELVDEHRRGQRTDCSIVRGIVDNFVELGAADCSSDVDNPDTTLTNNTRPEHTSTLQLYLQVFEDRFLESTRQFYKEEGVRMAADVDVSNFINQLLKRLDEEEQRSRDLLHPESIARVRKAAEEQLIGNHKELLQKEATNMIRNGHETSLKLVYSLLTRIEGGLNPIRSFFVTFVRAEGNSVVVGHVDKVKGKEDIKHNLVLIEHLVRLYLKHANMVRRCFEASNFMLLAIDDAFRGFFNRSLGSLSLPTLLAHYVDQLMKCNKNLADIFLMLSDPQQKATPLVLSMNSKEVEQMKLAMKEEGTTIPDQDDGTADFVTELVRFFMFLDDKDIFFETHRRLFAKRLLSNHEEDLETLLISKLRVQMGTTYTQRLSGMLQDIMVSVTMREQFSAHLSEKRVVLASSQAAKQTAPLLEVVNKLASDSLETDEGEKPEEEDAVTKPELPDEHLRDALNIEFNGHVLNALHWPPVKMSGELRAPQVLKSCQSIFSDFYMRDRESRKLTWIHSMSTVHLSGTFGESSFTFVVSTYQACILMLFNDRKEISLADIEKELNISAEEVQRHMKPLLVGRRSKLLSMRKDHAEIARRKRLRERIDNGEETELDEVEKEETGSHGNKEGDEEVATRKRSRASFESESQNSTLGAAKRPRLDSSAVTDGGPVGSSQDSGSPGNGGSGGEKKKDGISSGKEEEAKDELRFSYIRVNEGFSSRHTRVVVPSTMPKLVAGESSGGRKNAAIDRSMQVDAAIVRILKSRRRMSYIELSSAVIEHLSSIMFMPDPKMLKTRLERLIDQEYIARDENDAKTYVYSA